MTPTTDVVPATRLYPAKPPTRLLGLSTKDMSAIGESMRQSGFFGDVKSEHQAFVKILAGQELGVGPFEAMRGIHVIQGRLSLSAGLVANLVKRSGRYRYKVTTQDADHCIIDWYENVGGAWDMVGQSSFSMAEAKQADLVKSGSGWAKYPADMLFARALTRGARRYAADVLGGSVYGEGEIADVPFDVEAEAVTIPTPPAAAATADAETVPLVRAIAAGYKQLSDEEKVELKALAWGGRSGMTDKGLASRFGEEARDLKVLLAQLRAIASETATLGGLVEDGAGSDTHPGAAAPAPSEPEEPSEQLTIGGEE